MENITLSRIVALIKKLEEAYPETCDGIYFRIFDDYSGRFMYTTTWANEDGEHEHTIEQFGKDNPLVSIFEKYGV